MKSYLEYLKQEAKARNVKLLKAFRVAEVPTSTYYRTIGEATELRFSTASKVLEAIHEQQRRQIAAENTKQLRANDPNVSSRKARAGFKSRQTRS